MNITNIVDVLIVLMIAMMGVVGYKKGVIKQTVSTIGFIIIICIFIDISLI